MRLNATRPPGSLHNGERHMHYGLPVQIASAGLISIGIGLVGFAPIANARVTQITITKTEAPTYGGFSFYSVGQYERIDGTITGEFDPKDQLNAVIVDIGLAPKNPNGTVGYKATFQILRPMDLKKGNHRVIFELPNRGRTNVLGLFNDSDTAN